MLKYLDSCKPDNSNERTIVIAITIVIINFILINYTRKKIK